MQRILSNQVNDLVGKSVMMQGWAQTIRAHAKVVFIDLRDRKGLTQLVFTGDLLKEAQRVTSESVITVEGKVLDRPQSLANSDIVSGKVELAVEKLTVESIAKTLPMPLNDRSVNEDVRIKYRYLDLRSQLAAENIRSRHKMNQYIRNYFIDNDFTEVETPYISKSTPEGARDYLIPSRIAPGKFYALPQSPQQYKQLLMVAGIEKYFQIVRCFRDEDSRIDRQPEFSQLDVEISFTNQEEILDLVEKLYLGMVKSLFPEKVLTFGDSIPRMTYAESMEKYDTDRPDLRKDKTNNDELAFIFIVDFPMFEWKSGSKRWGAVHHPFTAPKPEWEAKFDKDAEHAIANQYDLALNGVEVAGGSIRIHRPEIQERVFKFLGHTKEEINDKFGHLLEAFSYGVPPHGGFASGVDRLYAVLLKEVSPEGAKIREIIAFPKAGDGHDLLMNAPSVVDESQLKELGLLLRPKK